MSAATTGQHDLDPSKAVEQTAATVAEVLRNALERHLLVSDDDFAALRGETNVYGVSRIRLGSISPQVATRLAELLNACPVMDTTTSQA